MSVHGSGLAPRVAVTDLRAMKEAGRRIAAVTAYDAPTARLAEEAGVDVILVGDSLGMTVLGHPTTLQVTLDDMVRATAAASRAARRALLVADMPFGSYQASVADAVHAAVRLLAEGGAAAVKLEGAGPHALATIEALVEAGIPVMGHVGLTPQSVNALGGYRVQGKTAHAAAVLMEQCALLEDAGAFSVVLECIPGELAERISRLLSVPTIGIGAGAGCDGQVQVLADLVGLGDAPKLPRHAKQYADAGAVIRDAVTRYVAEVRDGSFPTAEHTTSMDAGQLAEAELAFGAWAGLEPQE